MCGCVCFQVPGNVIRCEWSQRCHSGQRCGGDLSSVTRSLLWGLVVLFLFVGLIRPARFTWAIKPTTFTLHICSSLNPAEASVWCCGNFLSTSAALHKNTSVCVCVLVPLPYCRLTQEALKKPEHHIIPLHWILLCVCFFSVCINHFMLNPTKIIHRAVSLLLFLCWLERRPPPHTRSDVFPSSCVWHGIRQSNFPVGDSLSSDWLTRTDPRHFSDIFVHSCAAFWTVCLIIGNRRAKKTAYCLCNSPKTHKLPGALTCESVALYSNTETP